MVEFSCIKLSGCCSLSATSMLRPPEYGFLQRHLHKEEYSTCHRTTSTNHSSDAKKEPYPLQPRQAKHNTEPSLCPKSTTLTACTPPPHHHQRPQLINNNPRIVQPHHSQQPVTPRGRRENQIAHSPIAKSKKPVKAKSRRYSSTRPQAASTNPCPHTMV